MQYFDYLNERLSNEIFYKRPEGLECDIESDLLKYALGGTLYMPAIRDDIANIIISGKYPQMMSLVICLEDAIKDEDVCRAEKILMSNLSALKQAHTDGILNRECLPFIFIRVRSAEHFKAFAPCLSSYEEYVKGFVFPKFDEHSGVAYLSCLMELNTKRSVPYLFMPILESESIIYAETRKMALKKIKLMLEPYKREVINIRIGATDFCSHFGIRRGKDYTVYQIQVVRDCITDILNFFSRSEEGYVVSGTVWEYFPHNDRVLKPLLRATPFNEHLGIKGLDLRAKLIEHNLDGLIREIIQDKENGFIGKTVIHPSHLLIVNALYVVTHEEYMDACAVLEENGVGGVLKSTYQNKMNEVKPHTHWAEKIVTRAKIYGVFNRGYDYLSIIAQREEGFGETFSQKPLHY